MKRGFKSFNNAHKIKISQKHTCGLNEKGWHGCYAQEDLDRCNLGFNCKHGIPLEPCYKPITMGQYIYAMELRWGKNGQRTI